MTPSILVPGLIAVPSSGCLCDCAGDFNNLRVGSYGSSAAMSKLDVSGDGCGQSYCHDFAAAGGCMEYMVKLVKVGGCHLAATATDGRQASTDVTVGFLKSDCCGNYYKTGREDYSGRGGDTVSITFPGSGADGGP